MKRSTLFTTSILAAPAALAAPQGAQFGPATNFTSTDLNDFVPYDVDLDGDPDVLGTAIGGFGFLLSVENLGDGTYGTGQALTGSVLSTAHMDVSDLTGDGDLDVIVAESNGEISWIEFQGPNLFSAPNFILDLPGGADEIAMSDVDADGDDDILTVSAFGDAVYWIENQGNLTFGSPVLISSAVNAPNAIVPADLNGDGRPDVVTTSFNDDRVAWYPNLGGGTFGSQRIISSAADGPTDLAVADLNDDGVLDVLTASNNDDEIAWYRGTGGGNFATQTILDVPGGTVLHVGAADVDMDGLVDVYATSNLSGSNDLRWYQNLGFGFFGPAQVVPGAIDGSGEMAVYDADQDADVDFVFATGFSPQATDLGNVYCTSNPNSTGLNGQLRISGTDVRSIDAMALVATSLPPNTFGIFATSRTADSVSGPGGSAGILCLGGAIGRYQGPGQILSSSVGGTFRLVIDLDAMAQPSGSTNAVAGQTWRFQAWHRDVVNGGVTSNFTDASAVMLR